MAENGDSDLSDEEENSLLIACADSYETYVGSLESLKLEESEFIANADGSYRFEETQSDPSGSTDGLETSTAALQQTTEPLLKGSDLLKLQRPGYIWVSDLSGQAWCEMQIYYNLNLSPIMPKQFLDDPEIQVGTIIRSKHGLTVLDQMPVLINTKEDSIGLKILNLISVVLLFHKGGTIAREVPIFGAPFGKELFVFGIIDELRFNPDTYKIELIAKKKRQQKTLPQRSVKTQHRLQVMLYRKLFDDLVKGDLTKKTIIEKFDANPLRYFSGDFATHMMDAGVIFENLDQMTDYLLRKVQSLTCISEALVEYVHQNTMEPIAKEKVVYSELELSHFFGRYADFWLGKRDPVGVDIEEAYKCQMCEHAETCEWREKKNREYAQKNRTKRITY